MLCEDADSGRGVVLADEVHTIFSIEVRNVRRVPGWLETIDLSIYGQERDVVILLVIFDELTLKRITLHHGFDIGVEDMQADIH